MAVLVPHEDGTGYVNGKKVGSKPEWYFALALHKLRWDFDVQLNYFGGRRVGGGMVLDFLVYTLPLPTPVFIQGEYWHSGARKEIDALQMANLRRRFAGRLQSPRLISERKTKTPELAYNTALKEFGRA